MCEKRMSSRSQVREADAAAVGATQKIDAKVPVPVWLCGAWKDPTAVIVSLTAPL
jgi:hypothetical protein